MIFSHSYVSSWMMCGSTLMDAALLVIASNEPVPQPQTREHLVALKIMGVKQIIAVQTKIELVPDEEALKHYEAIVEYLSTELEEVPPVIPVSALHGVNLGHLIKEMVERFKPPERDPTLPPQMYVARSFDVNRPGTRPDNLRGGVLGGTIIQGEFKVGDEIEILPGIYHQGKYHPLTTEIISLRSENIDLEYARPGGLIGVGTKLDPALTKADYMVGNVVGLPGELPPVWEYIDAKCVFLERVVGLKEELSVRKPDVNTLIELNVGTATVPAIVESKGPEDVYGLRLKIPICAEIGQRMAVSMRISGRWRLVGYGFIQRGREYKY
ncbi:MAG TPA: translation initiation factor IF-2 subunit gamma [Candidatus Korarchaeota archaeon]|nr:translation initiation factor IF-2 subunit gamma [Candidatus Korarchaeota archaeon]